MGDFDNIMLENFQITFRGTLQFDHTTEQLKKTITTSRKYLNPTETPEGQIKHSLLASMHQPIIC